MNGLRAFGRAVEISEHGTSSTPAAHRHAGAYAAIVLQGEYTEISADGTLVARPGDVVVHPAFHQHANEFAASPTTVLNLHLPAAGSTLRYARLRLADLPISQEDIMRQPGLCAATMAAALQNADSNSVSPADNDTLALAWQRLQQPRASKVGRVAAEVGVSAEHLARGFRARYGMSPVEYRGEHRFRHAVRELLAGNSAAVSACDSGYADQSHMSRDFQQRVGMTPRQLQGYFASGT